MDKRFVSSCLLLLCNFALTWSLQERQACADTINNCAAYGDGVCTEYRQWAEENCSQFCHFCGGAQTGTDHSQCVDNLQNCADYGDAVCTSYREWAQQNCKRFCKFCTAPTQHTSVATTPSTSCADTIDNCAALGPNVCTNYVEFSHINCQKTCNLCAESTCEDKLDNCAAYGTQACSGQYLPWAEANCRKTCHLCSDSGDQGGGHYSDVCFYKGQAYQEGAQWRDGCEKNCTCVDGRKGYYVCQDMCAQYQNLPSDCRLETPPGDCCSKPVCPPRAGCEYKGQTYQEGQEWQDGCEQLCNCKDGASGYYECQALCIQWNMLDVCHLENPAPGLCCKTPSCPPNVHINWPPGYTPR